MSLYGRFGLLKYLEYFVYLPLSARFPIPMAHKLSDVRGLLQYWNRQASRNHARRNVSRVFPEMTPEQVRRTVIAHYQTVARDELEFFWNRKPLSFFRRFIDFRGVESLRSALKSPKGVLLVCGHFGSFGLFMMLLGKLGIRLHVIGRPLDQNPMHPAAWRFNRRLVARIEQEIGNPFILTGRGKYFEIRDRLLAAEGVLIMADVPPHLVKRKVPVSFLGQTGFFADGIVNLFKETGASLFCGSILRDQKSGRYQMEFRDVSSLFPRHEGKEILVQKMASMVERTILEHPQDWHFWDSLDHYYPGSSSRPEWSSNVASEPQSVSE